MYKKTAFEVPNFKFTFVPLHCGACMRREGKRLEIEEGNDLGGKLI